ncbi:hypothetical protein GUJ93_ZPchr0010g7469 [Zizania palustris]|uniref:Uncharacterized protein n=1 Tax=Zizania palustris TaxID=103762 RepID=A0A8J5WFA1_ZIZPA|nr:hypothetical protein GUJ93_ZPchr0010g7469 [Zizania palustris]
MNRRLCRRQRRLEQPRPVGLLEGAGLREAVVGAGEAGEGQGSSGTALREAAQERGCRWSKSRRQLGSMGAIHKGSRFWANFGRITTDLQKATAPGPLQLKLTMWRFSKHLGGDEGQ